MRIAEHALVRVTKDVTSEGVKLREGTVGAVVSVHATGYVVEFAAELVGQNWPAVVGLRDEFVVECTLEEARDLAAKDAVDKALMDIMDAPVVMGLAAQGHIPTIQGMLSGGKSWDEIGKAIGWCPKTAEQHYGWWTDRNAFKK